MKSEIERRRHRRAASTLGHSVSPASRKCAVLQADTGLRATCETPRSGLSQISTAIDSCVLSCRGRVLINAQIAAGYALTLRLRHATHFYACLTLSKKT
jgi:hypothetical protein